MKELDPMVWYYIFLIFLFLLWVTIKYIFEYLKKKNKKDNN